jgi:hypothetical protein
LSGPQRKQLREQHHVQHLAQVADAGRAAGAGLEADDALDRRHVAEAPGAEGGLHVDQLFGQFVQRPVVLGVAVDLQPGRQHGVVVDGRLGRVGIQARLRDRQPRARQQAHRLVIDRGRVQLAFEQGVVLGHDLVHGQHGGVLVPEDEFELAVLEGLETARAPR